MPEETYTFRRLIIEKYGEEKLNLGCKLVASFINTIQVPCLEMHVIHGTTRPDSQLKIHPYLIPKLITLFGTHTTEFFNSVTLKQ